MVTMLTVVPMELASSLKEKTKVKSYNTLPDLQMSLLKAVQKFMSRRVGYDNLPMACLEINKEIGEVDTSSIFQYLPMNSKETVLFQIEMQEDMIVSVRYQDLLDASAEAKEYEDDPEILQDVIDEFVEKLKQGPMEDDDEQIISFIPFLEYDKCKSYAGFSSDFKPIDKNVPGLEHIPLARLAAFMD